MLALSCVLQRARTLHILKNGTAKEEVTVLKSLARCECVQFNLIARLSVLRNSCNLTKELSLN